MRKLFYLLYLFFSVSQLPGQQHYFKSITARVSFLSSQHIYLKMDSARELRSGDTLYVKYDKTYTAVFEIQYLSTSSCAATKLTDSSFVQDQNLTLYFTSENSELHKTTADLIQEPVTTNINLPSDQSKLPRLKQSIEGRLSVSSYTNLSTNKYVKDYQRWRYSLSMNAENLLATNLSLESYINFAYRADRWNAPGEDILDKLKIYSLSLDYNIQKKYNISLGRKINRNLSSIGATDGLQFESNFSIIDAGIVVGSRPNYNNYGLSTDYLQLGAYVARTDTLYNRQVRNTVSVFQISKNSNIDRRFLYFQHSNNFIPNLFLITTGEVDLYERVNGVDKNSFNLTNIYISGRYSPSGWLSINSSYDIRKNVMYYETLKNVADSIFDAETRQGFRTRLNIKPLRFISLNLQYGTHSKSKDKRTSSNYGAFITYSRVPLLDLSATINFTRLITSYVEGNMYGISFTRHFFDGLLNTNAGYRRVEYSYPNNSFALNQDIIQFDAGIRLFNRDYLSLSVESIIENLQTNSRIYLNFTKRF